MSWSRRWRSSGNSVQWSVVSESQALTHFDSGHWPLVTMMRAIGIETEFGCLVRDERVGRPEQVVEAIKDYAFQRERLGVIDLHSRDYAFEPARSGGFLLNGGRLYVDSVGDHQEYATPECTSLADLVAQDKAGQRVLGYLLRKAGLVDRVSYYNNSIDHFGGHTFGCHENYSVRISQGGMENLYRLLIPFLVTRQIFAGAGRVGGHRINPRDFGRNLARLGGQEADWLWVHDVYAVEDDPSVTFQISQRADHIVKAVSSKVRFSRALINPKRDRFSRFAGYERLHLLFGESNPSEYATALKMGTKIGRAHV